MKPASRRIAFFVAYITIAGGLWTASNWWERGLATKDSESSISPNGCYRIDSFKPYWVLPDFLHPMPHPFGDLPPKWFVWWGNPAFLRLYDHRNGDLISETEIYDAESDGGQLHWGDGSGNVWIGMIRMELNLPDCIGDVPGKSEARTMKPKSRRIAFFVAYITIAGGLWTASNWWERGWATLLATDSVSPDGCYRVQSFKPYWVLPNIFHREPDVNGVNSPAWFPWWGYPGFYRLFDNRSGELISETDIYDLESAGGGLSWGEGSG